QRPGMSQTFDYDAFDRLTVANGAYGSLSYGYDATGNRLSEVRNAATTQYAYDPASNRMTGTSGAANEAFSYDAVGQLTSDSRGRYEYAPNGRMTRVTDAATGATTLAQYLYDADGMREIRQVSGRTIYSLRSAGGQVLSEYEDQCGTMAWTRDLIYAGGSL